jgi:eukaryotic-like serine/threonine-protein kinase
MKATRHVKRRRQGSALAIILIILLGIAGLVALLNWVIMPLVVGRGRETNVPEVVGLDRFAAESVLVAAGLGIGETRGSANTQVKTDYVISQEPAAGQRVKTGRRIRLEISTGAGRLKVPRLDGLTVPRATAMLMEAGLSVAGIESLRMPEKQVGQVVGSRPPAGTGVNQGDGIVLQVSSRSGGFPMPNLVGMASPSAQTIVTQQGLVVGEVKQAPSDEPAGNVLIQYPEEGMFVRSGDTVSLIVAVPVGKK